MDKAILMHKYSSNMWNTVKAVASSGGNGYIKLAYTNAAWQPQLTTSNVSGCGYVIYYENNATWCGSTLSAIGGADVYVR
jgi:hypothetical protein